MITNGSWARICFRPSDHRGTVQLKPPPNRPGACEIIASDEPASIDTFKPKMPHSFGYRARTRHMFKRGFKEHGPIKLSTFVTPYRIGDIVDIKANAAQQKGMPHKYYHGRTGIVYNVTPRAVGVLVKKIVGNRYIEKRVNLRVEHIRHSNSRQDFLTRVKANAVTSKEAKEKGEKVSMKRVPGLPRAGYTLSAADNQPQTLVPVPYETTI
ncbi:Ribosomal protein L21e [Rhizoctonia solani]|uniref:Ribosomal protein L21e n=1 Tax=Rhizoctonia solani TaxID=456999 RepID=A0A8H7H1K6_9AGAM|nr:Ribosomal protein L21e [Rhizoctonia solani]